jgi:predicted Zn-dependent peptidase
VYSRVIDEHLDLAFDVMSDMVWSPRFDDVDSEREVILEEIAMYEDDPQDKVFDVLGEAVFGDHPLGRSIIGSAEVVAGTPVDAIRAFHAGRYVPSNVVIAAAGAVDHDRLVEWAASRTPDGARGHVPAPQPPAAPPLAPPRMRFERKDTEQYHVTLGGTGIARDDERRFALRVLDTIFGGTSSSRLFQEIRERRGLAYAVYSFNGQYADAGQVGLYVGTRADNLAPAMAVVAEELERLQREPATVDELQRAKENLKGRVVLSLESTGSRMNRLGSAVLTGQPLLSVDEVVARIDAVSIDDVAELAEELFSPARLSAAGIGPDQDVLRAALEPLAPRAVQA